MLFPAVALVGLSSIDEEDAFGGPDTNVTSVAQLEVPAVAVTILTSAFVDCNVVVRSPSPSVTPDMLENVFALPLAVNSTTSSPVGFPAQVVSMATTEVLDTPSATRVLGDAWTATCIDVQGVPESAPPSVAAGVDHTLRDAMRPPPSIS